MLTKHFARWASLFSMGLMLTVDIPPAAAQDKFPDAQYDESLTRNATPPPKPCESQYRNYRFSVLLFDDRENLDTASGIADGLISQADVEARFLQCALPGFYCDSELSAALVYLNKAFATFDVADSGGAPDGLVGFTDLAEIMRRTASDYLVCLSKRAMEGR